MQRDRLETCVGEPAEIVPYLSGRGDVMIVDVTRDVHEDWRGVLPVWEVAGIRRVIVTMPVNRDPRAVLSVAGGEFIGNGIVSGRPVIVRGGVEYAFGFWVLGSVPPVSERRSYMPAHTTVSSNHDLDQFHESFRKWVLSRLIGPHESLVDPCGDDGVWTRTALMAGLRVVSVLRNEDVAEELHQLPQQRFLFEPEWPIEEEADPF